MQISKSTILMAMGSLACAMTAPAFAGAVVRPLGGSMLPILEGGLLTVAVAGLVAGIRIIRRKKD